MTGMAALRAAAGKRRAEFERPFREYARLRGFAIVR